MEDTVDSEIFARILFSRMRSFAKIKPSRNSENSLSLSDEGRSYRSRDFYVANTPFNTPHENKILAKFSEFTVFIFGKVFA